MAKTFVQMTIRISAEAREILAMIAPAGSLGSTLERLILEEAKRKGLVAEAEPNA